MHSQHGVYTSMSESENNPLVVPPSTKPVGQGAQNRARHKARLRAIQALYQWQLNPISSTALVKEYYEADYDMKKVDADYFQSLIDGVVSQVDALDEHISSCVKLPMSQLDPIELTVLRLSTFELVHRLEIPKRVVINEGVDLAKTYGASDGHKFVNGVLDKLSKALRKHEP